MREGGIVAFITSQGVLDAPTNAPIREYMMNHANLVGVARLPNNLFTDNAGTEVGSDLIILQRTAERMVNCITTKNSSCRPNRPLSALP